MILFLKILVLLVFGYIFYQDTKEREIYWFLLPLVALCTGGLYYLNTVPELFITTTVFNVSFILILLAVIAVYTKLKMRLHLLQTLGLGDILLFLALTVSFPTVSFIIIFLSALIFALVVHLIGSRHQKTPISVPLAGYMSLYYTIIYSIQWSKVSINLYTL